MHALTISIRLYAEQDYLSNKLQDVGSKSISKSLSKFDSLNQYLESHLHKNHFLYLFTLQQFFYIAFAL